MPKAIDDRLASYAYVKEIIITNLCESNNQLVNVRIVYELMDKNKNFLMTKKNYINLYSSTEFKNIIEILDIFNVVIVPQIISDKLDNIGDFNIDEYLFNSNQEEI